MSQLPLVSIVIPTFNRPVYLKRCIEATINQSYPNLELIVVDDNDPQTTSRYETELIMKEYESVPNIVYIKHDRNRNGSAARNTGWRSSHGQYITFIDDDDVIANDKIEKQVSCLEKLDDTWGMCYTKYSVIKEHGSNQISSENRSGNCYVDALMRTLFMGSGSNLLLRKSVVDEIDGYDESFQRNQDIEFLARALEHYKIAFIDELLLMVHQEGNRTVRSFDEIDKYTNHYLSKFQDRINNLNSEDRERVLNVISLERARVAFAKGEIKKALTILSENKVRARYIIKYCKYLAFRVLSKKSYGFNGN